MGSFDDLKEMRAVEDQQAGDPVERVQLASGPVDVFEVGSLEIETGKTGVSQGSQIHDAPIERKTTVTRP
jgi:hypothetical protein